MFNIRVDLLCPVLKRFETMLVCKLANLYCFTCFETLWAKSENLNTFFQNGCSEEGSGHLCAASFVSNTFSSTYTLLNNTTLTFNRATQITSQAAPQIHVRL